MQHYYVYILTNWNNKVMYIGVTGNLTRRLYEHKNALIDGFTKKYRVHKLVYYEMTNDVRVALEREKQLKGYKRSKKNALVDAANPDWHDLSDDWGQDSSAAPQNDTSVTPERKITTRQ